MFKRFLIVFVVTYVTISLSTSSSFQNNNVIQKNFNLFDNNILEIIDAMHADKDKGVNEFDIDEDNNDKDDDDDDDKNGKEDDDEK